MKILPLYWIRHTTEFDRTRVRLCFSKLHATDVLREIGWTRAEAREAAELMEERLRHHWIRVSPKRDSSLSVVATCVSVTDAVVAVVKKFWKPHDRLGFHMVPKATELREFVPRPIKCHLKEEDDWLPLHPWYPTSRADVPDHKERLQ